MSSTAPNHSRQVPNWAQMLKPKSVFARKVLILVGGTAGSQLLIVAAAPIITRLYTPEAFGTLAIYLAVLAFVAVNASFRYEMAIPLAEYDEDAIGLVVISLALVGLTSIASAILVACLGKTIAQLLHMSEVSEYLWLLPISVLCIGTYQVFNAFAVRQKKFSKIATSRLKQSVVVLALQITGHKLGALGLIGGQAIGQGVGSMSLGGLIQKTIVSAERINLANAIVIARKYHRFPMFSTFAAIFNTLSVQLPAIMLAAIFGSLMVGFYSLAYRVLTLPITVIGNSIGNVFLSDVANAYRIGELAKKIDIVHQKLVHLIMPFMLILALLGPKIFALIFGKDWEEAGTYARWMTPWLYMVFITSPLCSTFEAMGKQHHNMLFQAALLMVRVGAIIIGAKMSSIQIAIIGFSIGSALCWLFFLTKAFSNVELGFMHIVQPTTSALLWGSLCILPLILAVLLNVQMYTFIACSVLSLILCAFRIYCALFKSQAFQAS